ncbi:MAG: TetR/AcrR family transcriptional regulator [Prochloraceae cyanobacterium]|nr:TetR/AcrR family transcriptional regulator [Prochloraceae cyanobacterium]
MKAASAIDTKEQILNVAEELFAEQGFAGTSLRQVIKQAGVNLSAVHYHFGSKEELFRAVVAKTAQPIVKKSLEQLAIVEAREETPNVETILEAFLTPSLQVFIENGGGDRSTNCARLMGRCRTEPDPIQKIADDEFEELCVAYLDALQRVLPEQSRNELDWKLDLVVAGLIRVLSEAGKSNALIQDNSPEAIQVAIKRLVNYFAPAMRSH